MGRQERSTTYRGDMDMIDTRCRIIEHREAYKLLTVLPIHTSSRAIPVHTILEYGD